jgi:cold shock CspA family protein|eukprot:3711656-Prymnesium_polylepis.2
MMKVVLLCSLSLAAAWNIGMAPKLTAARCSSPVAALTEDPDTILTGSCKWFNDQKGFGFIDVDGEADDLFVHQSEIYAEGYRSLAEGEKLEFKCTSDQKTGKLRASEVTGPDKSYVQGAPRY